MIFTASLGNGRRQIFGRGSVMSTKKTPHLTDAYPSEFGRRVQATDPGIACLGGGGATNTTCGLLWGALPPMFANVDGPDLAAHIVAEAVLPRVQSGVNEGFASPASRACGAPFLRMTTFAHWRGARRNEGRRD
jgi:hypothetical protein